MRHRRRLAASFLVLLQAGAIWYGTPPLLQLSRLARSLAPRSMAERRDELFGPWYVEAEQLRAAIPRGAVVDIVMTSPNARDIAVLAGAMLQPCTCQYFDGTRAWRQRQQAIFLHDARAANAAPGNLVRPGQFIIVANPDETPALRMTRGPQ
jgi:hypothetical protein